MPTRDVFSLIAKCVKQQGNRNFSLEDSGTGTHVLVDLQGQNCQKIKIDGEDGLTVVTPLRCDWCIRDCDLNAYLFIELKSSGSRAVTHAMAQIACTYQWFQKNVPDFLPNPKCYAVMKRGCPKSTPAIQNEKLKFKRKFGLVFKYQDEGHSIPLYADNDKTEIIASKK